MSDFTNKDVEYLIQKANISYEDAFNLLTHCGGDLAKALEYLQSQGYSVGGSAKQETPVTAGGAWRALQVLYGFRVKIRCAVFRDATLLADGYTVHVCVDAKTRRPIRVPESLLSFAAR